MVDDKYVGADAHSATTSFVVLEASGKVIMEAVTETQPTPLISFVRSIPGRVHLTFEEGTMASWLYDLLQPHVAELIVCDPRQNKRLSGEDKGDRIDAGDLAERLRGGFLKPVYHGQHGTRQLKELVKAHEGLVSDSVRSQNRLKAIFRSRGIQLAGHAADSDDYGQAWCAQLREAGLRRRAEWLFCELHSLEDLRAEAKAAVIREGRKHRGCKLLGTVPGIGPLRAAQMVSQMVTPHRFRTKRQLWKYAGLAVVTFTSDDYRIIGGEVRKKKRRATRGLNRNYNRILKDALKGAAQSAASRGDLCDYHAGLLRTGMREEMAKLTLARKIAAISLAVWKKGEPYREGTWKNTAVAPSR